ncbi:TPA: hypothetical protein ACSKOM_002853 [Listeria monocytogenes]|uniref:hypothetical protein n=1 Tax=Listeria TaxID=1637 RepID=UPI00083D40E8|nr:MULTISPECIES: hypothetical protein [Listeria]EAE8113442.1 hypothetical protein [Listeria monocytogenes]EAE8240960.1 hypothetical protein [Listeria monocytogenes]EAF6025778.1 hypothetical protein [Listeria monocytogenes]EAG0099867.1 hypothetical protein [Listeria monocytogenes]EAG0495870.1 hypothetical protein [Listeria monocytogenes]
MDNKMKEIIGNLATELLSRTNEKEIKWKKTSNSKVLNKSQSNLFFDEGFYTTSHEGEKNEKSIVIGKVSKRVYTDVEEYYNEYEYFLSLINGSVRGYIEKESVNTYFIGDITDEYSINQEFPTDLFLKVFDKAKGDYNNLHEFATDFFD